MAKKREVTIFNHITEFEVFLNALSVGWHLNSSKMEPMNEEQWDLFTTWMERHGLKKK